MPDAFQSEGQRYVRNCLEPTCFVNEMD